MQELSGAWLSHADEAKQAETAVHGCHCSGDMAVHTRIYWSYRGAMSCDPCTSFFAGSLPQFIRQYSHV